MTDTILVLRKITLLRDHMDRLRRRRPDDLAAYVADIDLQDAAAMSLLVAIQEAVDIALHIAAAEGWGLAESYAGAFEILAKNGVIDPPLASDLGRLSALRNRLAHGYASVDPQRLWVEIPLGLDQLGRFVAAVAGSVLVEVPR